MRQLIPTLAIWDDHDFGHNNTNKENPFSLDAQGIFRAFYAQTEFGDFADYTHGPGISSHLRAFGQEFLFLDDRSFRTPRTHRTQRKAEQSTQWGAQQEEWIADKMAGATGPVWILNGSQFFGRYQMHESVEKEHPQSLQRLMKVMNDSRVPAILVSGDVHYSEIMSLESELAGYGTYELTSSAIHSHTIPMATWLPNKRRIESTWRNNFLLVDAKSTMPNMLQFHVNAIGPQLRKYFEFDGLVIK